MNLVFGKCITQIVAAAAELGIADRLKAGPKTSDDVAREVGADAPALYRLMRALSLLEVLNEEEGKKFSLTPMGRCLCSDAPESLSKVAIFGAAPYHSLVWNELLHCVKTGSAAVKKVYGVENLYDWYQAHPKEFGVFNEAMTSVSTTVTHAIVEGYDFSGIDRLGDVGGGHGALLASVLTANPRMKGLLFDLPEVVSGAKNGPLAPLGSRVEIVGGSFLESVPAGCDAYMFKHVIANWRDDACVTMLKNAASGMSPKGRILLVEHVVPGPGVPSFAKLLDLEMLVFTPGGMERTLAEYESLFDRAGLKLSRVVPLKSPMSVIEGVRK